MNRMVEEANFQGTNRLGIALLVVTAMTLVSVLFIEDEWADRADDLVVIALAVGGLVWYWRGANRYGLSAVPLLLNGAAFLTHVVAIAVEQDDPKAVGDNFLTIQYFLFTTVLLAWQFLRLRQATRTVTPASVAPRREGER